MVYRLFPPVKKITYRDGVFHTEQSYDGKLPKTDDLISAALEAANVRFSSEDNPYRYCIGEVQDCVPPEKPQGYTLKIEKSGICVAASDRQGLRYGLDTLRQILSQSGEAVQCLQIEDYPTVLNRGLMLDISRGKVYTREYLLQLTELLSKMRYNVLQLYTEHTFDFKKHPKICAGSDPITADDIRAIQNRCSELGIELQANLQCLGHCRRILTREEYMDLSESDMFWSLCTTDDKSLQLIDDLFSEYLPLFDSEWVNICFDEPYDIGKGRSAHTGIDGTALYVEFLKKVHGLAAKYGKKIMIFGDVAVRHPEFLEDLPKDIRYLDWCYDPKPHYGTPAVFHSHHLDYWVSPGSGNWNTLFPRFDGCITNVSNLLTEAMAAGVGGMLYTDWNDHGGYTQPAAGYYGYGYAAAMAWSGESQTAEAMDAHMDRLLGLPGYSKIIRTFAKIYQLPPIWSKNRSECVMALFDEPIFGKAVRGDEPPAALKAYDLSLPEGVRPVFERHSQHALRPFFSIPEKTCDRICELAACAGNLAEALNPGIIRSQLCYQAEAFRLMTDKLALSRKIIRRFASGGLTVRELVLLEDQVRIMIRRYVRLQLEFTNLWLQIARPSEIEISLTYFAHIIERLDYLRDWMSLKREALSAGGVITEDFSDYETAGYGSLPTY